MESDFLFEFLHLKKENHKDYPIDILRKTILSFKASDGAKQQEGSAPADQVEVQDQDLKLSSTQVQKREDCERDSQVVEHTKLKKVTEEQKRESFGSVAQTDSEPGRRNSQHSARTTSQLPGVDLTEEKKSSEGASGHS